jgi:hypothetical protein
MLRIFQMYVPFAIYQFNYANYDLLSFLMTSKTVMAVSLMRHHPVTSILTVNVNSCKPYGRFYWMMILWTPTKMASSFDVGMGSLDVFSPASLLTLQTILKSTCFNIKSYDCISS